MNNEVVNVNITNKTKFWKDFQFYSLIVAILIFILTIFISFNLHSPFKPKGYFNVHLIPNTFIDNQKYDSKGLIIVLPITFINSSKTAGIVEEIFINVSFSTTTTVNTTTDFFEKLPPKIEITDIENFLTECNNKNLDNFRSFLFESEKSVQKNLIFSLGNIEEGNYKLSLWIETDDKLINIETKEIKITPEIKKEYLKGNRILDVTSTNGYMLREKCSF